MGERKQLGLADVEHMSTDELVPLITDSFDALVTVALAEAVSTYLPQRTRRLLRKKEWRQDWQDALLCAAGELQVATERMRYAGDPRLDVTEHRLRRVRLRGNEASVLVKKSRRHDFRNSAEHRIGTDSHLTAVSWMRSAFPDEYAHLLEQERVLRGVGDLCEEPSFRDVHEQIEYAVATGRIAAPRTAEVEALLAAERATVRGAVAEDAKNQDERNMALRHPLMLGRWENALRELGIMTAQRALAETPHALGTLPQDFYTLPPAEATMVLNARRFLAAVQQRRVEYRRYVRRLSQDLRDRERENPRVIALNEIKASAGRRLVDGHPSEYAFVRDELRPHEVYEGRLPVSLVSSSERAGIKHRVLAALVDGTDRRAGREPRPGRQ